MSKLRHKVRKERTVKDVATATPPMSLARGGRATAARREYGGGCSVDKPYSSAVGAPKDKGTTRGRS